MKIIVFVLNNLQEVADPRSDQHMKFWYFFACLAQCYIVENLDPRVVGSRLTGGSMPLTKKLYSLLVVLLSLP